MNSDPVVYFWHDAEVSGLSELVSVYDSKRTTWAQS